MKAPPAPIRHIPHRLEGVVVIRRKTSLGQRPSDAFRLKGADLIRLENCADGSTGGDGILLNELSVPGNQAAEVLRPGTIQGALQHRVPALLGAQLLRIWRGSEEHT